VTKSFCHQLKSSTAEINATSDAFRAFADGHGLTPAVLFAVDLALEEILSNIIFHGYNGQDDLPITVEATLLPDELMLRVEDAAPPFDPLKVAAPDLTIPLEDRKVGGLGIHLTRKMMDSLEYTRRDGRNVLTMRKRLEASP
jgi:anti-sigma regulatory factor (Ser/Thr protein kinase)